MSAPSWPSDVVPEWQPTHDRNPQLLLPRGVFDKYGPHGEIIETPTDHRLLWYVRDNLIGCPDYLRPTFEVLNDYLAANCQHHWRDYPTCCEPPKPDCHPPHRQCLWCNSVEWLEDKQ